MDGAVAALLGALVGAMGSFGGVWLQQRAQSGRELAKAAAEIAAEDYRIMLERTRGLGGGTPPLSLYVAYHADVLRAIAADRFDAPAVHRIESRLQALHDALPIRGPVDRKP